MRSPQEPLFRRNAFRRGLAPGEDVLPNHRRLPVLRRIGFQREKPKGIDLVIHDLP
jgi:hypothetical protein